MYLSPSKILYTNCLELGSFPEFPSQACIVEVTRTIQRGGTYPRLQVVKKDGHYFTLNDTQLRLYRYLEKVGQCGSVQVDRVPIREVPEGIRNLMRAPDAPPKGKCSRKQKGKYHSVESRDGKPGSEGLIVQGGSSDDDDDDDEPSSDDDDTDDESDWSDDDGLSDTDVDTSADERGENDDSPENACESESFI